MKMKFVALSLLGVLAGTQQSEAVLITGVSSITGASAATINSILVSTGVENDINGAVTPVNFVNISLDVLQKHVPFSITFDVAEATFGGSIPNVTEYLFTFQMANMISSGHSHMNGFDLQGTASTSFGVSVPSSPPGPTSDRFAVQTPNLPGVFRFGGLQGGGGNLLLGDTATSTLPISVFALTNGTGTFTLTLTANPEPGTMILGSLALIPCGIAVRRRRQMKQEVAA